MLCYDCSYLRTYLLKYFLVSFCFLANLLSFIINCLQKARKYIAAYFIWLFLKILFACLKLDFFSYPSNFCRLYLFLQYFNIFPEFIQVSVSSMQQLVQIFVFKRMINLKPGFQDAYVLFFSCYNDFRSNYHNITVPSTLMKEYFPQIEP